MLLGRTYTTGSGMSPSSFSVNTGVETFCHSVMKKESTITRRIILVVSGGP